MNTTLTLPPLSLYVHIPWCIKKCPYCDFNSHESEKIPEQAYVKTLIDDLKQSQHLAQGRKLGSIFFGGGTPSLFTPDSIATIIDNARELIGFEDNIEITLEANPGAIEQGKFSGFYQAGVNRLSIGVQSFDGQLLEKIGRIHNGDEANHAITQAHEAGFTRVNIDLMHGLPGQSVAQAISDLSTAIEHQPSHISWYQLTIEPNTAFYKYPPLLPVEDALESIQTQGEALLADAGFMQYEVSAYSKPNQQARHNINYWQFGDYIGVGAGAHGKITQVNNAAIIRTQKTRAPNDYIGSPNAQITTVEPQTLICEFLMNTLRLNQGVPVEFFSQRTGLNYKELNDYLSPFIIKNLIQPVTNSINTTDLGRRFLNAVLEELV